MYFKTIWLSLIILGFTSCKTSFSFEAYPPEPEGIMLSGKCLVNPIRTSVPIKNPEKVVDKMMSDLQKFIPRVQYAGHLEDLEPLDLPLDPTVHPHLLETLYLEFAYDYLIDYQASADDPQVGSGIAFGPQHFDHEVSVSISVFDTRAQKSIYHQRITLKEIYEESDEYFQDKKDGLLFTRSSENLLTIGIKKCNNHLRKSIRRKIESDSSS